MIRIQVACSRCDSLDNCKCSDPLGAYTIIIDDNDETTAAEEAVKWAIIALHAASDPPNPPPAYNADWDEDGGEATPGDRED